MKTINTDEKINFNNWDILVNKENNIIGFLVEITNKECMKSFGVYKAHSNWIEYSIYQPEKEYLSRSYNSVEINNLYRLATNEEANKYKGDSL